MKVLLRSTLIVVIEICNKSNFETFIGVYWQIKRIKVSEDEIEKKHKFDNMIKAIKSRKALPKYSVVLWEVYNNLYNQLGEIRSQILRFFSCRMKSINNGRKRQQ